MLCDCLCDLDVAYLDWFSGKWRYSTKRYNWESFVRWFPWYSAPDFFFVNKALPWVFKETLNRKVFQNKERKRARKKLTVRTIKNYFLIYLLFENKKNVWPKHLWKCRVIPHSWALAVKQFLAHVLSPLPCFVCLSLSYSLSISTSPLCLFLSFTLPVFHRELLSWSFAFNYTILRSPW